MKRTLVIAVAAFLVSGAVMAAIENSHHDFSSSSTNATKQTAQDQLCVFCHTPHQPSGTTTDPLWNHTLGTTAGNFTTYSSDTLNADASGGPGSVSLLCLSCHDGTVAIASVVNQPNAGNLGTVTGTNITSGALDPAHSAYIGTDISNDHPIGVTYADAIVSTETSQWNSTPTSPIGLFGGKVECASCHDPHEPGTTAAVTSPFLVTTNANSALCQSCHQK